MAKPLWAGLDVGVDTTRICIMEDSGEILHEATCATCVRSVYKELALLRRRKQAKVTLEAATGFALARGLRNLGFDVQLLEQRQLAKFLRLRRNKTDAGDAIGIAEAARLGATTISRVHLKSLECQWLHSRLAMRRQLIAQRVAASNLIGRQIEIYGGRLRRGSLSTFTRRADAELKIVFGKAAADLTYDLRWVMKHCDHLISRQRELDAGLSRLAAQNDICRRFMEIPGVGPVCALSFYSAVGDPFRFDRAADVGSYFGLTPQVWQSGSTERIGRISKMGNRAVRTSLVTAAKGFMHWSGDSELLQWAQNVERRRGRGKARVALARKLGVIMIAMWKSGTSFHPHPV